MRAKFSLPHHGPAPFTLVVLIVVIIVKEFLYRVRDPTRQGRGEHRRADRRLASSQRRSDFHCGRFIGISIALIGGEGWQSADDWAALFACAIIAANGYRLLFPALHEILDTAPRGEIVATDSRSGRGRFPECCEVEKCLVRKMGLSFYVDLHVGVDGRISVRDGHDIAHRVKDAIKRTDCADRRRACPR